MAEEGIPELEDLPIEITNLKTKEKKRDKQNIQQL